MPLFLLLLNVPFVIRGYSLADDTLFIHRVGWKKSVPLQNLISVKSDPHVMRGSIGGSGGHPSANRYGNPLGPFEAYANDGARTVVLRFPNRILVVSPGDPEAFVAEIRSRIAVTPP